VAKKKRKNNKRSALKPIKLPTWLVVIGVLTIIIYSIGYMNAQRRHAFPIVFSNISTDTPDKADILFIGDDSALLFNPQIAQLINDISKNLNRPAVIYNYADANENIFRTFYKLKQVKDLAPIVIYMGGASEFYERLIPENIDITYLNYKLMSNEYISVIHTLFPSFKKYLMIPDKNITLNSTPEKGKFKSDEIQKYLEVYFKQYEIELRNIVNYIEKNGSTPIVLTSPVNLLDDQVNACPASQNEEIKKELEQIENSLENSMVKDALAKARELNTETFSNARVKYLYGKALYENGSYSKAKAELIYARSLNCTPQGAHPIINAIIKKVANSRDVYIYDFDKELNLYFGTNELFLGKREAQVIYYEKLRKELMIMIKDILTI
tara:strand:- start:516 stop:1661 length:1146 start_codon:yes stop_codon:yes gene_type:complete